MVSQDFYFLTHALAKPVYVFSRLPAFCKCYSKLFMSSLLPNRYGGGGITPGLSGRGVKITTHIHVVPRLRKCGAIPPLNQNVFMAWWLLKHKTALILLYLILYFSYLSYKLLLFPPISAIRWLFLCVYPATPQRNFTSPVCILVSWLFLQTMSYFHIWLFVQQSFCIISVVAFRIITDSFPAHFLVGYNLIHACNTHTHTQKGEDIVSPSPTGDSWFYFNSVWSVPACSRRW